ncbi:prolyl aminopeptidase [Spirillospora sp. NPDC052269]
MPHLPVSDGNLLYWEAHGTPNGRPAIVLHGGPGSGCNTGWLTFFDLDVHRVVLLDQRNCGRSLPHASEPEIDLSANTTQHLVADIERLREHLGIDRWTVLGGSWGSTLALAYAEAHPDRVTDLVLFSVVTTTHREVEWITRGVGRLFPGRWEAYRDGVPEADRDGNLAAAYSRLLHSPDPEVRDKASRDWCAWEDTHMGFATGFRKSPRYEDPAFRMCFARLVTHYWKNAAFMGEDELLLGASKLAGVPGTLVHGRLDVSSSPDIPWNLARAWPDSEFKIVDTGHDGSEAAMLEVIRAALLPSGPSSGGNV